MPFNSWRFIFFFLPAALAGLALARRVGGPRRAMGWLIVVSAFYYASWSVRHFGLLLAVFAFNYSLARVAARAPSRGLKRWMLRSGIILDLGFLVYFKYAPALGGALSSLIPFVRDVALPAGFSFIIFQQIAYVVDVSKERARPREFLDYLAFSFFFPQLISGPIVRGAETLPQFMSDEMGTLRASNVIRGLSFFFMGLVKKMIFANTLALLASPAFDAAARRGALSAAEAWYGAVAYAFQVYFDFSGYTDMAVGAGLLFGVKLPLNFNSPYKAASVIEFWNRWHMSLSRFFRDYVYVPLSLRSTRAAWPFVCLVLTMMLIGAWHGVGGTFIAWGVLHGLLLAANYLFRRWRVSRGAGVLAPSLMGRFAGTFATFASVVFSWVFFRSADMAAAFHYIKALAGDAGFWPAVAPPALKLFGAACLAISGAIVFAAPNSEELVDYYGPLESAGRIRERGFSRSRFAANPVARWAAVVTLVSLVAGAAMFKVERPAPFIYLRF